MGWRWYPPKAKEKLGKGWTGPYLVVQKLTDIAFQIQKKNEASKPIYVHTDQLKLFEADSYPHNWLGPDINSHQFVDEVELLDDSQDKYIGLDNREVDDATNVDTFDSEVPPVRRSKRCVRPPDRLDL